MENTEVGKSNGKHRGWQVKWKTQLASQMENTEVGKLNGKHRGWRVKWKTQRLAS